MIQEPYPEWPEPSAVRQERACGTRYIEAALAQSEDHNRMAAFHEPHVLEPLPRFTDWLKRMLAHVRM